MKPTNPLLDGHEQVCLSAMMNGQADLPVSEDDFASPPNRTIYRCLTSLTNRGLLAVQAELNRRGELKAVGGAPRLTDIACTLHDPANVEYALSEVLEASRQRRAMRIFQDGVAGKITVDEAQAQLAQLLQRSEALPSIEDAAELVRQPLELPEDVIEGILHRGAKMVLGGASKSYKTWTLIDLAVSVATGAEWFNGYPTKKGRVLYVNFELSGPFFTKRIRTICDERQLTLEPGVLSVWNLRGHVTNWAQLRQKIPSGEFVLIIIDPVYKLLLGRDENKAGDIASLMDEFEVLAVKTAAAVAFGAHYSKGNQASKESIDRIGGSGVFARDPDSILNFTKHEQPDCFTVEMTLRNHPPREPFVVKWEYPLFTVENMLDPTQLKRPGRPEKYDAKDLLTLIDEPLSASQIAKKAWSKFKIGERRVYELLAELKACGLLNHPKKRGLYELP